MLNAIIFSIILLLSIIFTYKLVQSIVDKLFSFLNQLSKIEKRKK